MGEPYTRLLLGPRRKRGADRQQQNSVQCATLPIQPKIAYEIAPSVYLKAGWHWQTYQGVTVDDETPVAKALSNGRSSGMLLGMEYDSRDFEPNPEMGSYWNLEWSDFRHQYGSDTNYQQWLMNVRHYLRVSSQTIVAMELYSQAFTGDVPWYDQAMLGDDQRMRGYYQGQYRDRNQLSTQVEVRHSFNQRHGMVAWVGAGTIAPHYNELLEQSWLPTVGIGYRFAFKARIMSASIWDLAKRAAVSIFMSMRRFRKS
ncbi:BamA/TamA family outer membrane protein [Vibrio vulnificus]|nr:BamA/TamA family outer membrane protein [Vibrio vulnificus]